MDLVTDFLFSSALSGTFLGIMAGMTIFFILLTFFAPKIRQKTSNKSLKKTLARSTRAPMIFTVFFLIFFLLRLENSESWIGSRLWLLLDTLVAIFWITRKILFYTKMRNRITKAEKRRKKK